jgi:hypothetical protein
MTVSSSPLTGWRWIRRRFELLPEELLPVELLPEEDSPVDEDVEAPEEGLAVEELGEAVDELDVEALEACVALLALEDPGELADRDALLDR